jgi:hypothetical protein
MGYEGIASGYASLAAGETCVASGDVSHAEGGSTTASNYYAHAEGQYTKANGHTSHAEGYYTTALNYQHAEGHYNNTSTATVGNSSGTGTGTLFVIGNGTSSAKSNAFRVTANGQPYGKAAYTTTGADYAEFFEWQDGNPNDEDRRGYFVTLDGNKIKIANKGDYILGIISGLPSVIGNGDEDWMGRYILDEFGDYIYEDFEEEVVVGYEIVKDEETGKPKKDENGKIIRTEIKEIRTGKRYKENPDYDPTQTYIQRQDRPEWDAVGMLGVLSVRDNGECQVNGYCELVDGGTVVPSEIGYRVIKRVSDNVVKIVFK